MPFFSLQDNTFPFLTLANHNLPTTWDHGIFYQMQLFARFIKVSKYNIQYWSMITSAKTLDLPSTWNKQQCMPYAESMCQVVNDADMLLFPTNVVDMPSDWSSLKLPKSFAGDNLNMSCESPYANRQLTFNDHRYEISLCDLVDGNLEFVYDVDDGLLFWRKNDFSDTQLIITSILSLYLFTKVCEHFLIILTKSDERPHFEHSTCTLPFLLACYYAIIHLLDKTYLLTDEENFTQIIILMYILTFNGINLLSNYTSTKLSTANYVSIASTTLCLFLLTSQMHSTYDTPFQQLLNFIFGARMNLKIFNYIRIHSHRANNEKKFALLKLLHIFVDMFVFLCIHVKIGPVVAQSDMQITVDSCNIFVLSFLAGAILHSIQYET